MAPKKKSEGERRDPGKGSVYEYPKGSGKWIAALTIEGRDVRRRAASEQAAEAKLAELHALKQKHINVQQGTQTYHEWLDACHEEKQRLTEPKARTIEFDRGNMERYIIPKMGALPLLDIRPYHIQRCLDTIYAEIRKEANPRTNKRRYDGARTVHAVARIVETTLTLAFERHLIPDNPYSGIRLPKYRRKKIVPMDDDQCRAFLLAAAGELDKRPQYKDKRGRVKHMPKIDARLSTLWAAYLFLGFRRGEGLGQRWVGLDLTRGTIKIDQQIQRINGGELVVSTPKTEDSERELPLPRRLLALYRQRWDDAQAERVLGGVEGWHEHGLIFPSESGTPLWPDNIETMFRRIRAAAGLPDTIKLHHLRHTLATLLDECGCTESLKADILGHSKQTQSGKYTHGRIDAMRTVLQAVEDRILGGKEAREREIGT